MHPFHFSNSVSFTCADPDSSFIFEPASGKFHWYGKTLDKLGKYLVVLKKERLFLELEYNYAREQTFTVITTDGADDALMGFVLKNDRTGELNSFLRTK